MNQRILLSLTILVCSGPICFSQCYYQTKLEGITFFYKQEYSKAKKNFETAKAHCDDLPACHDLDTWIKQCNDKMKTRPVSPPKPTSQTSQPNVTLTKDDEDECRQDCYITPLNFAIVSFQSKNYAFARDIFLQISECPCLPSVNDISLWIEKCHQMLNFSQCLNTCFYVHYNEGKKQAQAKNYKEAMRLMEEALKCGCTPDDENVATEFNGIKKLYEDYMWKTKRLDTMTLTLFGQQGEYIGDVQYGTANGAGVLTFNNHPAFKTINASFAGGEISSTAEIVYLTGEKYVGSFTNGQLDSSGSFHDVTGNVYQGEYVSFFPNGKGRLEYKNGDIYVGNFQKGKRNGFGILYTGKENPDKTLENCQKFEGNWSNDFKMGHGKCFNAGGVLIHEGVFRNDFPEQNYPNRVLKIAMDFVLVPKGTFLMGCQTSSDCEQIEMPVHKITVDSFYISKYEVTVAEYRQFCRESGYSMPVAPPWGWIDKHPIVNVSWNDAMAFCQWNNCRLPTEAEWEYAARGGNQSGKFQFSGSNSLYDVGIYEVTNRGRTQVKGMKKANELGIFDMSGNVAEWCSDFFGYFSATDKKNPQGPPFGREKIVRGGGWQSPAKQCKVHSRSNLPPASFSSFIGFRVVKQ